MTERTTGFRTNIKVPTPRLIFYALVGLLACAGISYYLQDRGILIGGSVGIPVVIALILWAGRVGRSEFVAGHVKVLMWIYVAAQLALLIWDVWHRK